MSKKELFSRVMCGEVLVNGEKMRDPKRLVPVAAAVELLSSTYVSRGGWKLEHALRTWKVRAEGCVFLDAGASTGGFTDCLLQHGAALVHAVDVGHNQLAYPIRSDARVHVMERSNIMHIETLDPAPHEAVADLSFRSLRGAAAHILSLTTRGVLIALLKPQFEYRPHHGTSYDDEFTGVVGDSETAERILRTVLEGLETEGIRILGVISSPIRGHRGNREFLLLLRSGGLFTTTPAAASDSELQGVRETGNADALLGAESWSDNWRPALSQAVREAYGLF